MSFSSGLSGVAAANKDLSITGNNVANASTVGFKTSRAEFGDAYTTTILGTGGDAIGSGVNVDAVAQKFTQGNITSTNSVFDLAIDGSGFFVLGYDNGAQTYTRAGMFGVDSEGYITNNQGGKLQGFGVDENGVTTGILQDLTVESGNQPPKGTQSVETQFNVAAGASVLQQLGSITRTNGLAVGVAQVGQPEATSSVLSSVNTPTTAGTPSYLNTNTNLADILTAGSDTPMVGYFQTSGTPSINSVVAPAVPDYVDLASLGLSDSIDITINTGSGNITAEINPITTIPSPANITEVIAGMQTAINNNSTLAGHVLVRDDGAGSIEVYSTDGTTFPNNPPVSIPGSGSTLATELGFTGAGATDTRVLLDAFLPGSQIDLNYNDAAGTAQTVALTLSGTNYASQAAMVADLQTQIDASAIGAGVFVVQTNPFNSNSIEIVPDVNNAVDEDFAVTSITNNTGSVAQNLGLTSASVGTRYFQNPPASSDTVQIQIQDPNINGGTPYTALIRAFPNNTPITTTADLIATFQEQIDDDPVLSGRVTFQEDPDNAGTFQLISSSGTRIISASDLVGSIADDLKFSSAPPAVASIFSSFPPSSTSTVDITLQGPNLNGETQIVENIEPFPAGTVINNMNDLVASFQSAIDGNQNLAGKLKVSEDPNRVGFLQVETYGSYATDGTNILSIADNVGSVSFDLGLDLASLNTPTTNTAIAGLELFANGGSIDLTTVEGTPATVQGNLPAGFTYNDFTPGTKSELTGAPLSIPIMNTVGGGSFDMTVVSGANSAVLTINVPSGGFVSRTDLANAVTAGITASAQLNGVVQASIDASNRLTLTNVSAGAQSISIFEGANSITGFVDPVQNVLGMTTSSSPQPVLSLGTADTDPNNELTISVGGDNPGVGTIRIPAATYTTTDQVVESINGQISSTAQLTGKVEAQNINGRIVFSLNELGGFPNTLAVTGTNDALEAFGHSSQSTPPAIDPVDKRNSFRVNLSVPLPDEDGRSGSVEISLDENIRSIEQLAAAINRELNSAEEDEYIGVRAEVENASDGTKRLNFIATQSGEASQISITNVQAIGEDISEQEIYAMLQVDAFDESLLITGEPEVSNGYPVQSFVLYDEKNDVRRDVTIDENLQASQIASQLSELAGVKASAETNLTIYNQDYVNSGQMDILINDQRITANSLEDMVEEINLYQQTTLSGITAEFDEDTGDLMLHSKIGTDIKVQIDSSVVTDSLTLRGVDGTAPAVLGGANNEEDTALVGGVVDIILNEGYSMIEPDPRVVGLFYGLTSNSFEDYVINEFNPDDPESYNDTASITTYDSLGNQHSLQMYFVKEPDDPQRPLDLNYWTVYAQIDGENIGDPDGSLPYPQNLEPTIASHKMYFNADGTIDEDATGPWLISNWDPIDEDGNPNGAFSSLNVAEGGSLPISTISTSSNFEIDLAGSTQYGGPFSRANFQQDGYASGQLKDLEVGDDGIIYARYTNGEAQILGQVATASFRNVEGLSQVGHTEWQESFDSGDPTIGEPGTGVLGSLRSSALEDSTVDLSEQLVHLIIAQRNYQASAKTIETANAVTQTIINLR